MNFVSTGVRAKSFVLCGRKEVTGGGLMKDSLMQRTSRWARGSPRKRPQCQGRACERPRHGLSRGCQGHRGVRGNSLGAHVGQNTAGQGQGHPSRMRAPVRNATRHVGVGFCAPEILARDHARPAFLTSLFCVPLRGQVHAHENGFVHAKQLACGGLRHECQLFPIFTAAQMASLGTAAAIPSSS